ncbi:MAG: 3,4-dihydroxy-2-butanone-4-phosphate synthase [Rhodobacterales bacterium]|nr:3,4-dihydroxy-2-butanone-4-phosphate synthase [Rhodobacterales bacterium]
MNQTLFDTLDTDLDDRSLLDAFGNAEQRVDRAVAALRAGGGILVVDDADRENEGDIIFAVDTLTEKQMALLIRECTGIVCLCLPDATLRRLELPQMVDDNTCTNGTAFTVSIEAKRGVTTGVSAADRVTTVKTAAAPGARPEDLARPGHVFPLRAQPGGVLTRRGHTEATIDLVTLAGHGPAGVLCELMNADGTMARLPQIIAFGRVHGMPVVSIEDLVAYRQAREEAAA